MDLSDDSLDISDDDFTDIGADDLDIDLNANISGDTETTEETAAAEESALDNLPELSDELETLAEEGVKPVTDAPDNISYLEEDELASDDFAGDDIDLSDAVIDEPELSADGIEDALIEPSIDDESEFGLDSLDDITIDSIDNISNEAAPEEIPEEINIEVIDDEIFQNESVDESLDEPLDESLDEPLSEFNDLPETPVPEPAPQPAKIQPAVIQAAAPVQAPAAKQDTIAAAGGKNNVQIPSELKSELRNILSYMDQLLESLPEEKIEEFAKSDYFDSYKKLFKDLGLV